MSPNDSPLPEDAQANLDHVLRLAAKSVDLARRQAVLKAAAWDACGALTESIRRAGAAVPIEVVFDLWQTLKDADVAGRRKIVESMGYTPNALLHWKETGRVPLPRPGVECVYLLLDGTEVVYVGRSRNMSARLAAHRCEGVKVYDSWQVFRCPSSDAAGDLEAVLQQQHRPRYNKKIETRPL